VPRRGIGLELLVLPERSEGKQEFRLNCRILPERSEGRTRSYSGKAKGPIRNLYSLLCLNDSNKASFAKLDPQPLMKARIRGINPQALEEGCKGEKAMQIVGELINASRKAIGAAIEAQDVEAIQKIARDEFEAGANYIDVNAGISMEKESDYLKWLVTTVQEAVDVPCCIDSANPNAIETSLSVHKGQAMLNSISLERERYEAMIPMISGTDCKVVALCMSDSGMPATAEERMAVADALVNKLVKKNVPLDNLYVDPLVQPLSTNDSFGIEFLNAIEMIMKQFPGIHTICGLSNISYGLPKRKLLNQAFVVMAIAKGLDCAIINPLDQKMMANIIATESLAGKDDFCGKYLKAYRENRFEC